MKKPKNLRANDQLSFTGKKRADFTVRKYGIYSKKIYSLLLSLILIAVFTSILVYNESMIGAQISLGVGVLLLVFAKQLEKYKKTVEATEFLSALFSSALGAGYKFCIMVKQSDGQIVYMNRAFQQLFPDLVPLETRKISNLFSLYKTSDASKKAISDAIKKATAKETTIKIESGTSKKPQSLAISIEPILRPSGFSLVRGK